MSRILTIFDVSGWDDPNLSVISPILQIMFARLTASLQNIKSTQICLKLVDLRIPVYFSEEHSLIFNDKKIEKNLAKSCSDCMLNYSRGILSIIQPEHLNSGVSKLVSGSSYEHEWLRHYLVQPKILDRISDLKNTIHRIYDQTKSFKHQRFGCWIQNICMAVHLSVILINLKDHILNYNSQMSGIINYCFFEPT
jgi:hypothetical protein